ncbi:MAG: DUF1186 domain-containing protein [Ardenticatenaceae bacterium]|nr:DUF1186 domain-containing protein [Ardenticatenaceae bacterium]
MDYESRTEEDLLKALETAGRTPPLKLIRACLERQESLTPGLLAMFEESLNDAWEDDDDPRWFRLVHAGMLLLAYREPAALPIFEKLYTGPDDDLDMLEWFETDLSYYGATAVPTLLRIASLDSGEEYHYGRSLACDTLSDIGALHPETRTAISAGLRALLPKLRADGTVDVPPDEFVQTWTNIAIALGELQDEESRPLIEAMFEQDLMDEGFIGREGYEAFFDAPSPRENVNYQPFDILEMYEGLHHDKKYEESHTMRQGLLRDQGFLPPLPEGQPFSNRLNDWANDKLLGRSPDAPKKLKVGRNDPCPCGSGLKYKKCHGKPGSPPL